MSLWWLVVGFAIFLIGVTKSGFGSGVGLMIVPMTLLAMGHIQPVGGTQTVLGLILPLLCIGDLIAVGQYRKLFNGKVVSRLMPGTVVEIAVMAAVAG